MKNEKRPRQHFADLMSLKPEDRPAAIEQIPKEHRGAVAMYIVAHEIRRNGQIDHYAKMVLSLPTRAQRRAALTAVPADVRPDVEAVVVGVFENKLNTSEAK